ncbi:MAG: FISUMP domain-containing protein, partial [Bacteroidales bacterium]
RVLFVRQNTPNPFTEMTTVTVHVAEKGDAELLIRNTLGQRIVHKTITFEPGTHLFDFYPGNDKFYLLSVSFNGVTRSIKMIRSGGNTQGHPALIYSGSNFSQSVLKTQNIAGGFNFSQGDLLRYAGYAGTPAFTLGSDELTDDPDGDQDYLFHIIEGIRCPGVPTVTDMDGNTYNTVLIGEQCWMKENLKTTTYRNGEPIIYIDANSAKEIVTTGAYNWYDHDSTLKDSYGALYNWYAVDDTNGLCPEGWHVPTNSEWNILTDLTWGTTSPYGNKLKSCRQVNSPLGGDCNTVEHPRWEDGPLNLGHGTDDYGFSGLPGGYYGIQDDFYSLGSLGYWWTATEVGFGSNSSWFQCLFGIYAVVVSDVQMKGYGFSVRCVKDQE